MQLLLVMKVQNSNWQVPLFFKVSFFHEFIMSHVDIIVEDECAQKEIFVNIQRW